MSCQCGRFDLECLCSPGECHRCTAKLFSRDGFLVEITFTENEKMPGRVVLSGGITFDQREPQLINVAVAVYADVVGDVAPAPLVLMELLMLKQPSRRIAIVAEHRTRVMDRHSIESVGYSIRPRR